MGRLRSFWTTNKTSWLRSLWTGKKTSQSRRCKKSGNVSPIRNHQNHLQAVCICRQAANMLAKQIICHDSSHNIRKLRRILIFTLLILYSIEVAEGRRHGRRVSGGTNTTSEICSCASSGNSTMRRRTSGQNITNQSMQSGPGACECAATSGGGFAVFVSIVQAIFFSMLGTVAVCFGPVVTKTVIFVQSLIASQLLNVINLMLAVTMDNIFDVLQGIFFVITGGLTMAFATLKNAQGRAVMQGMLVGNLVATPLLTVIGNSLYSGVAGCADVGDPTKDFPQGEPTSCTSDELFLSMFYVMKAITWAVTLCSGMLGTNQNLAPIVAMFSSAMTGAELFWKSLFDLLYTFTNLADPELADDMVKQIATAKMFLTYIAAAFGMLSMYSLKMHLEKQADEKACKGMSDAQKDDYFFRKKLSQAAREKYGEFSEEERYCYKRMTMEQREKFISLDRVGRHRYANMTEEEEFKLKKSMAGEELDKYNGLKWEERVFFKNLNTKEERNEFLNMSPESRQKHTSSTEEERKAVISGISQGLSGRLTGFIKEKAADAKKYLQKTLSASAPSVGGEVPQSGPLATCMGFVGKGKSAPKAEELDEDQAACIDMTEDEREDYYLAKNMTAEEREKFATPEARKEFYMVKRMTAEEKEKYGKMSQEEQAFYRNIAQTTEQPKLPDDLPQDEKVIHHTSLIQEERNFFIGLSAEDRTKYMAASMTERETIRNPGPSTEKVAKEEGKVDAAFSSADLKGSSGLNGITDKMKNMEMAERLKVHDDKCKNMTGEQRKQYNEENMTSEERLAYKKREEEKKNKGKKGVEVPTGGVSGIPGSLGDGKTVSSCWSSVGFAAKGKKYMPKEMNNLAEANSAVDSSIFTAADSAKKGLVSASEIPLKVPEAVAGAGSAVLPGGLTEGQDKLFSTPETKTKKGSAAGGVRDWPPTPASALSVAETPAAAAAGAGPVSREVSPSQNHRGTAVSGAQLLPRRLGGFEDAVGPEAKQAAEATVPKSQAKSVTRGSNAEEQAGTQHAATGSTTAAMGSASAATGSASAAHSTVQSNAASAINYAAQAATVMRSPASGEEVAVQKDTANDPARGWPTAAHSVMSSPFLDE